MWIACAASVILGFLAGRSRVSTQNNAQLNSIAPTKPEMKASLSDLYTSYSEKPGFNHWLPYAEVYESFLPSPAQVRGQHFKMLEIGVQSGGSARLWHQWYGKDLYYVGIDINPRCMRTQSEKEKIFIEIGSQLDRSFLMSVCFKHGPFDVIIDDGGHTSKMMRKSFSVLFPNHACMKENSTYVIEDTHTMMMGQSFVQDPEEIASISSQLWFRMHHRWQNLSLVGPPEDGFGDWGRLIRSIHLYDSMMLVKRGPDAKNFVDIFGGSDWIPYRDE